MTVFASDAGLVVSSVAYLFGSNLPLVIFLLLPLILVARGGLYQNFLKGLFDVVYDTYFVLRQELLELLGYIKTEGPLGPFYYIVSLAARVLLGAISVMEYLLLYPREALFRLRDYFLTPREPGRGEGRLFGETLLLLFPAKNLKLPRLGIGIKHNLRVVLNSRVEEAVRWIKEKPTYILDLLRISRKTEEEKP